MAWLGIFSSTIVDAPMLRQGFEPHGRVAPDWDLLKALPTELTGCGYVAKLGRYSFPTTELRTEIQSLSI